MAGETRSVRASSKSKKSPTGGYTGTGKIQQGTGSLNSVPIVSAIAFEDNDLLDGRMEGKTFRVTGKKK